MIGTTSNTSRNSIPADEENNLHYPQQQQQLIEPTCYNKSNDDAGKVIDRISSAAISSSTGGLTSRLYKGDSTISNANSSSVSVSHVGDEKHDIIQDNSYDNNNNEEEEEEDSNKKTRRKGKVKNPKSKKSTSSSGGWNVTADRSTASTSSSSSSGGGGGVRRLLVRYVVQKVTSTVGPTFQKLPKPYRYALVILWSIWKVITTIIFLNIVFKSWSSKKKSTAIATNQRRISSGSTTNTFRILHIVTALQEYDTKSSTNGDTTADRLANILLPVLTTVVHSLTMPRQDSSSSSSWSVDVYLILGYKLLPHRYQQIKQSLPPGVGLQVWDDAIPLGYDEGRPKKEHLLTPITRTLARQHRFVLKVSYTLLFIHHTVMRNNNIIYFYSFVFVLIISSPPNIIKYQDKLDQYDFFTVFEDDMLFTAQHVQYFLDVSHELQRLTREAKQWEETISSPSLSSSFYGNLTSKQLQRLLPGFFRVEVLPKPPTQEEQQQLLQKFADSSSSSVPIDPTQPLQTINPNFCCRIQKTTTTTTTTTTSSIDKNNNFNNQTLILQQRLPLNPQSNQLITWETAIQGFSLRQFPTGSYLDWVAFLPGVRRLRSEDQAIPSYWTGTYSDPKQRHRPFIGNPQLFAQQGGFMLSRQQIQLLENDLCVGRFLPPFQEPLFLKDGLWQNNVEFYGTDCTT